jgi:hypothetical protein
MRSRKNIRQPRRCDKCIAQLHPNSGLRWRALHHASPHLSKAYKTAQSSLGAATVNPRAMSPNHSNERSGCFSGLLPGSRRQRGCQSAPLQGESAAPLAPQESSHGKSLPAGEFVSVIYADFSVFFLRADDDDGNIARIRANCQQL